MPVTYTTIAHVTQDFMEEEFRADAFNVFNLNLSTGEQITSVRSLGAFTPNASFFQLALKYHF